LSDNHNAEGQGKGAGARTPGRAVDAPTERPPLDDPNPNAEPLSIEPGKSAPAVNRLDVSGLQYRRVWPQMPHFLSGSVRRIAQSLRQNGVAVEFGQDGGQSGGKKWIRLQEAP
jgi:hypothetical protein